MADTIERTIYKLEIDDSGYIRGVENMSASTKQFAEKQLEANKRLQENELQLKKQSDIVEQSRRALDAYTGKDQKYRNELERKLRTEQELHTKLVEIVANVRKGYEAANKAAQDFANTSQRAANLQPQAGARISPSLAAPVPQIIPPAVLQNFDLGSSLADSKEDFDALAASIAGSEEQLSHLGETKAFTELSHVVSQGKDALNKYNEVVNLTGDSHVSLRTQIRLGREELVRLEAQGKANSKEYFELEKRVASLTDKFNDQQQRIRILASDTKLLDFGKGAITAATSAFQTYASVAILVGGHNEELQKKTLQLFAAMQLLQSLEQLSNLTRREGVLATLAQSAAQSAYTAVVGASTGALRAFRLALVATGIGGVIAGIAFLIIKYNELREATREAREEQKLINEVNEEAIKTFTAEVTHLKLIKDRLNDLSIPQKERVKIAKEYNKTAEEGNKIDLKQIDNIALINRAIDSNILRIQARARARAAESVIVRDQEDVFLKEEQARIKAEEAISKVTDPTLIAPTEADQRPESQLAADQATGKIITRVATQQEKIADRLNNLINSDPTLKKAREKLERSLATLGKFITTDDLITITGGTGDTKGVENVFAQRLKELQAKLAEVTAKSFESEGTIRKQFQASLEKEIASLNELVKDKKLTSDQATILIELTTRINEVQLNEALDQFNKKVTDARNKLNEELRDLQRQNTEESIQLLQDEFERRKQLIDFNEKEELAQSKENTDERLAALEEQRDLVGEQAYQDAKNAIVQAGEDAQTNIIIRASQDRQQLAQDSFKKSLDFFQNAINEIDLIDDEDSAKEIRALSDKFLAQKITFETFQKELEKIEKDYAAKKRNRDLLIERGELSQLEFKLTQIEDKTSVHYKELLRLRDEQAKKVAELEKTDAVKDAQDTQTDDETPGVQRFVDTANAIGAVAESIVQFWQTANEAEAAALDRSISLQERRVDAAQRIAERGNAQYLKAEEDRLKELEIARENAARKQLGIDAALQASQILVGITGAIAKIATPGIGIAETIGSIAVIVGALATGYGLVKSLQGVQPRLFKGTKYLERDGHPSGRDTIPVMANEGEAWIPTETNKKYHPAVSAIYDQSIPADVMNSFVNNYTTNKVSKSFTTQNLKTVNEFVTNNHKIKPVPQPNYQRIKEAAEISVSHDGKMAVLLSEHSSLLKENNDLQREILRKKIHVENKIDGDGVSSMVYEYLEQQRIARKT